MNKLLSIPSDTIALYLLIFLDFINISSSVIKSKEGNLTYNGCGILVWNSL
jgi:hypothetical protein